MKRRTALRRLIAGLTAVAARPAGVIASAPQAARPIQLHCDLAVDPRREQEMLDHFEKVFRPTAARQPGFIDLKMDRLRTAVRGPVPAGGRFRFVLTFRSEELRQQWVASADHQRVWPPIEAMLTDKEFGILVYDVF